MITEDDIKAAGADVAPRITPADIEANIIDELYFTALDGYAGTQPNTSAEYRYGRINSTTLGLLTFCVLVLRNGFTVTGESACASPENFNAEIGRKVARANAIDKVWGYMGYELRTKLADIKKLQTLTIEDFPLGKACDLSGEGICEACQ